MDEEIQEVHRRNSPVNRELIQLAENGSKGGDDVSCYTRHLGGLMEEIGLPDARENRRLMDRLLREILGYSTQDECSLVWTELKRWLAAPTSLDGNHN